MIKVATMVAQRLGFGLFTLFVVSLLIFFAVELLPGDLAEAILGRTATPETVAAFRRDLGLDQPAPARYISWLGDAIQGEFGRSLATDLPISESVSMRLRNTLFLAFIAAAFAVPLGLFLGLTAALYRNTLLDRMINVVALMSISVPEFFIAYVLILCLSVHAGLFPSISDISPDTALWDRLYRSLLPSLALALGVSAHLMRMTRAAIINVLASPYIEMANLKGLTSSRIIVRHALPNALAPIANVTAFNLAYLVVGVVVVEAVFAYPGLGQLLVDSVAKRDIPVVQAASLIFAMVYILLNLLADILSILTNPRLMHPR